MIVIMPSRPSVSTVRLAAPCDVDALVAMASRFQGEVYSEHLFATPATFRRLAEMLIEGPTTCVWVATTGEAVVGMLAVALYGHPMSGELMGTEMCWWVDPPARGGRAAIRLLTAAEQWAQARGAVSFQMAAPAHTTVGAFYERLGYSATETLYTRRLP